MRRSALLGVVMTLCVAPCTWKASAGLGFDGEPPPPAVRSSAVVRVLVADLAGAEESVGKRSNAVLCIKLFQTLRKSSKLGHGKVFTFGEGELVCGSPTVPTSHAQAEALAKESGSQLVLWGAVHRFGDDVVVQPFLTLPVPDPDRKERKENWRIGEAVAEPPRRHYVLPSIVLQGELLEAYRNPAELQVYRDPALHEPIAKLGGSFRALANHGKLVQVQTLGGKIGYLDLRDLLTVRSSATDFTAAVIRIFRADWEGARDFFQKVLDEPHTGGEIRIDSLLYAARCQQMNGLSDAARRLIDEASALSAYDQAVARYAAILDLASYEPTASINDRVARMRNGLDAQSGFADAVLKEAGKRGR